MVICMYLYRLCMPRGWLDLKPSGRSPGGLPCFRAARGGRAGRRSLKETWSEAFGEAFWSHGAGATERRGGAAAIPRQARSLQVRREVYCGILRPFAMHIYGPGLQAPPPTPPQRVWVHRFLYVGGTSGLPPAPPCGLGGVSVCTCMYGCMYVFVCKYVCVYV